MKTSLLQSLRQHLENHHSDEWLFYRHIILFLIFSSFGLYFVIETMQLGNYWRYILSMVDMTIVIFFSLEILIRFVITPNKWEWIRKPSIWIDILAILPFYLSFWSQFFLHFYRGFLFLRTLSLFKRSILARRFSETYRANREDFKLFFLLFVSIVLFFSFIIFQVENPVNPHVFDTIGQAMWWTIVTMFTVGYGDIVPVTSLGRLIAAFVMLSGVSVMAILTGIVVKGFFSKLEDMICENCGHSPHDEDANHCKKCGQPLPKESVISKQ